MTKKELEAKVAELSAAAPESTPAPSKTTLPSLDRDKAAKVALGVDGTYTSNVAVFRLGADGEPLTKKDGGVRKPLRIHVSQARWIAENPERLLAMVEAIEANAPAAE